MVVIYFVTHMIVLYFTYSSLILCYSKKCDKVGDFAKVCRSKSVNNRQYRSNDKSARFSGTRKVHMVTDDGEIQGTVDLIKAYGNTNTGECYFIL